MAAMEHAAGVVTGRDIATALFPKETLMVEGVPADAIVDPKDVLEFSLVGDSVRRAEP